MKFGEPCKNRMNHSNEYKFKEDTFELLRRIIETRARFDVTPNMANFDNRTIVVSIEESQ